MAEWIDFGAQVDGLRDAVWRWSKTPAGAEALRSTTGQDAVALLRRAVSGGTLAQVMHGLSLIAGLSDEPELVLRHILASAAVNAARGVSLDSMGLAGCEGWLAEAGAAVESGNAGEILGLIAEIAPRAMADAMMRALRTENPAEAFFGG